MKSLFKGRVPFVYYLHPQGMRMTPFTLCWSDESNYGPKGSQPYILHDLVKPRFTLPSESLSHLSAQFPGAYCPIFLLYKVRFLSPNVLLWALPIPGSFGMSEMVVWDKRPATCAALFFSELRHCSTGRKAFCIHTCLHLHSTHFINTTQHPYSRTPYSLPHMEHRPLCEEVGSYQ